MTEDQHHPTSGHILGHLGSDHGSPEPGAGSNALALCHDRHASRSSAFITAAAGFALGALLTLSLNTKRKQIP